MSEIIHEAKSALLTRPQDSMSTDFSKSRNCEFSLEMLDTFKLRAINLICNVNKLEIFEGPLKSYRETIYGMEIEKNDSEEETLNDVGRDEVDESPDVVDATAVLDEATQTNDHKCCPPASCYRYDIDASSIGVTALDIRVGGEALLLTAMILL